MRKLGAVALGIPVIVGVYLLSVVRRSVAVRIAGAVALGSLAGLVALASVPPAPSTAVPRSTPRLPVAADFTSSVRVGHELHAPVQIRFSAPMDGASVAAALRIQPDTAVRLAWSDDGSLLSVLPLEHWAPDTLYTIVVASGAAGETGGPLRVPLRAAFLTADAGAGTLAATRPAGERVALGTAFEAVLDRPVDVALANRALRTDPPLSGSLEIVPGPDGTQRLTFVPDVPLTPDTTYRVWFEGLVDASGVPFTDPPALRVTTAPAPSVVRFRPRAGTTGVERDAAVSVRFTEPMERAATAEAFRVIADGAAVDGTVSWAEGDTVLVFRPAKAFPWSAKVAAVVDAAARSKAGAPLAAAATGAFTVEAEPPPPPKPRPTSQPVSKPPSGGGGAASGSWTAVESYYLKLMNCTRTGGLVTSSGSCSSPGGRDVAPLRLDAGISSKVSRPYAKLLATRNLCSHFIGGDPGDRLRAGGYTSYRWAENLGCRSGDPYAAVLGSHLYFQSERNWSPVGGHYKNMMNAAYDRAGIGVWVSSGRVRLVVNLYHP